MNFGIINLSLVKPKPNTFIVSGMIIKCLLITFDRVYDNQH